MSWSGQAGLAHPAGTHAAWQSTPRPVAVAAVGVDVDVDVGVPGVPAVAAGGVAA